MTEEREKPRVLDRVRGLRDRIDRSLDKRISRTTESVDRTSEAAAGIAGSARERTVAALRTLDETGGRYIGTLGRKSLAGIYYRSLGYPKTVLLVMLVMTTILVVPLVKWDAIDKKLNENEDPPNMLGYLNLNMNAAFDIYLPEGEETSEILDEVRQNWTIDLIILYFETENAHDPQTITNITDVPILDEMTRIETGRDGQGRGLNYVPNDHGEEDDFIYVLSVASIVRELNGSSSRAIPALYAQAGRALEVDLQALEWLVEAAVNQSGTYRIPDDQDDVDDWVRQVDPRIMSHLVTDTNGDGVWDSAISLLGLISDLDFDDITVRVRDFYRSEVSRYNAQAPEGQKLYVRDTGTIPVTKDVQDRSVEEGINALVVASILVLIALFFFHRTLKILIIALVPVTMSILLTFSFVAIIGLPITPQIIAVGPILIAMGVAYGLYIANRYAEESRIEDKTERIKVAVQTTGKAVFLSAITTAGGFGSNLTASILPLQTVSFTLSLGIMLNYAMALTVAPALVVLLDYKKREEGIAEKYKKISPIPLDHTKKILVVGIVLVLISGGLLMSGAVGSDVDFLSFAPDDQESLTTFKDYAHVFKGGETGMVIVRGAPATEDRYEGSMKDYDVLQGADNLEVQINDIPDVWAISIVDIYKTLTLKNILKAQADSDETFLVVEMLLDLLSQGGVHQQEKYVNMTYWELIQQSPEQTQPYNVRLFWIEVVYDSLNPELREFFVNNDYSKMLIFIDMPIESVAESRGTVNDINRAVTKWPAGQSTSQLTGVAAIGLAVNDLIFMNAITSLFLSLVFVLFILIVLFRSVRYAVLTIIPLSLAVALLPLSFYLFQTPLTIVTAMLGSIVVGAGVDYSILTTTRLREEGETLDGLKRTIETSGRSFVEAATVTLAGLTAGFIIPIQPIYVFIALIQFLLLVCALLALFYLPAVYAYLIRGRVYDELVYGQQQAPSGGGKTQ
ncbi:MAG: MMPL family transporter [Thermoplasmata archaeon]|nr:MMPL family transporter [Thermoplasmata archaeon]